MLFWSVFLYLSSSLPILYWKRMCCFIIIWWFYNSHNIMRENSFLKFKNKPLLTEKLMLLFLIPDRTKWLNKPCAFLEWEENWEEPFFEIDLHADITFAIRKIPSLHALFVFFAFLCNKLLIPYVKNVSVKSCFHYF